ncbi:MAG: TetR/AcrR family transcriptional regulator, partial [Pseudomonadota bacterium]
MVRTIQKRTLETRARLIAAAEELIDANGFEAMRVEEVVLRAGTAKGTFFAHFPDKDALMDLIIGRRIDALLDKLTAMKPPVSVQEFTETLMPLCELMTSERYVFDIVLRYSGAAAQEEIGAIAMTFGRQVDMLESWLQNSRFRRDIPVELAAEGVHSFMIQAMALKFCALHNSTSIEDRLGPYLEAWLEPKP